MSNDQKKTILIAGYYGFGNTGDEAILGALLSDLKERRPNLEFIVVSGDPAKTAAQRGVRSILWTDMPAIMEACRESDLILVGGGGLFHDYWGTTQEYVLTQNHTGISFYGDFPILAALYGKPCMLYSVGVGPLMTDAGKSLTKISFETADAATVRDVESLEILRELGVPVSGVKVTADPAFMIRSDKEAAGNFRRGDCPLVAVCLRNWDVDIQPQTWQAQLAHALDLFVDKYDASLVFIPFQVSPASPLVDDLAAAKNTTALMKRSGRVTLLKDIPAPEAIAGMIAQSDLVIGMRLHALVFAVTDAVPAVGLAYDPKVKNLMRAAGMDDFTADLTSLNSNEFFELLEKAWLMRGEIKNRLVQKGGELKTLAEENGKTAARLLEDSQTPRFKPLDFDFVRGLLLKQTRQLAESEKTAHTLWLQLENKGVQADKPKPAPVQNPAPSASASQTDPPRLGDVPPHRPDIVCFSIIDWEFRYQRPQQIMSQFAAQGHRVFYISPSRCLPSGAHPGFRIRRIKDNVYEVMLAAAAVPDLYGEQILGENLEVMLASLEELRNAYQIREAVSYVMIASWGSAAMETARRWGWRVVYDCMDEWDNFPLVKKPIVEAEFRLVRECDLLVVTAQRLYEKWQGYNRPMVLARNAADYDFYIQRYLPNDLLANMKRPIVGYYGAIADWFDLDLMTYLAESRPEYTFVLVGGLFDLDISRLQALPNVHWLGQQPYETMPQYLYHFDACIIPFKINPITGATDPVKIYEYMCGGKPVVSVALPELKSYADLLHLAGDRKDFASKLDRALAESDPDLAERRRLFARQNSWDQRVLSIDDALENVLNSRNDPNCPLPLILPAETLVSSRRFTDGQGAQVWLRLYEKDNLAYKQTSLDLAEREYRFLSQLGSGYFPEPVECRAGDGYSVVATRNLEGDALEDAAPGLNSSPARFHEFARHCLDLLMELEKNGIAHRDIRRDTLFIRDGKPVLSSMTWAVDADGSSFDPFGLGGSERPTDGGFSDVYSMGKILEFVGQRRHPAFDWVIGLMTARESSMRVTELSALRLLFDLALSISQDQQPLDHPESNVIRQILVQSSLRDHKLAEFQRSKDRQDENISSLQKLSQDLTTQVGALTIHAEGLESTIAHKDDVIAHKNNEIQAIYDSNTWKAGLKLKKASQFLPGLMKKSVGHLKKGVAFLRKNGALETLLVLAHRLRHWSPNPIGDPSAQKSMRAVLERLKISPPHGAFESGLIQNGGLNRALADFVRVEKLLFAQDDRPAHPLLHASRLPEADPKTPRRNILFIAAEFPNPHHGGGNRVINFIKALAPGNDIYLCTAYVPEEHAQLLPGLEPYCRDILKLSFKRFEGNQERIRKWIGERKMDIVHYEWPRSLDNFDPGFGRVQIFTYMEAVSLRLRMDMERLAPLSPEWVGKLEQLAYALRLELVQASALDARVAVTTKDAEFFRDIYPGQEYSVLNHGLSFDEFVLPDSKPEPNTLVFVGNYLHYPNAEAMDYFFAEIWENIRREIPDARIYLVGANPTDRMKQQADGRRVIVTGPVEDVRPYIQKASVCIAPLISGAGLRGKVIEYAALRRPFVATSIASTDLVFEDGVDYFRVDKASKFSERVVTLLKNPHLAVKMADHAFETARQNYDTQRLAGFLLSLYDHLEKRLS
jgi:polysaccharide pyruvyl transferase CsaB